MDDRFLERIIDRVASVPGLTALVLGGSRARGTQRASSDYDLGLYYEPEAPLDIDALRAAVLPIVDRERCATVSERGAWGPWINGGGWLSIDDRKVDLLYRDLGRVRAVIAECRTGRVTMDYQPGHPHGFCSAIWMGEAALCRPLLDPRGAIDALKREALPYPSALRRALVARFRWEVGFSIDNAALAIARGDGTHVGGCAYRALCCLTQVVFAVNERYLINEKAALAEAGSLPSTIPGLESSARAIWAAIGAGRLDDAIDVLRALDQAIDPLLRRG